MPSNLPLSSSTQSSDDKDTDEVPGKGDDDVNKESGIDDQERTDSSAQDVNTDGPSISTANANINTDSININFASPIPNDPSMPSLEETGIFDGTYDDEDVSAEADLNYLETTMNVEKALYGLHQAPRAWYETFSTYLLENGFRRGTIDKTLFIKKDKGDILLVQVKQKDDGIFISQDKYVADILKKFDFASVKTASTPIETNNALLKDEEAEDVDVRLYRSMIG
ncbi:putative ribonuclease H-like domain-containing protein [Tanacetum coccineum]